MINVKEEMNQLYTINPDLISLSNFLSPHLLVQYSAQHPDNSRQLFYDLYIENDHTMSDLSIGNCIVETVYERDGYDCCYIHNQNVLSLSEFKRLLESDFSSRAFSSLMQTFEQFV